MSKYVNEMENYLYNHNYISENNNNIKQQELSIERASCIVQKHRTLTEEKDKEIEGLNKDLQTAIDICNNRQKEIVRLNNIINELEKDMRETMEILKTTDYQKIDIDYVIETLDIYCNRLKELKEDKIKEKQQYRGEITYDEIKSCLNNQDLFDYGDN